MTTDKSNKDRCWHYSGVDKGFYCWKCVEHLLDKRAKEIFEDIENNLILNKYFSFQIKKLKQKWCK